LDNAYDLPRVLGALAVVIGLIFLLRWLGKRFSVLPTAQRSSRVVQVLSRSVLSPKQQLVLVRVGQRVIVAADNGSQLSSLSEITDPDEVASLIGQLQSEKGNAFGTSSAKAFNSMFGRLKKSYGSGDSALADTPDEVDDLPHDHDEHADPDEPGYAVSLSSRAGSVSNDNVVAATRQELNGLMEKVRLVSDQFGRT
jgi:flagellar biogenesis protein FliO